MCLRAAKSFVELKGGGCKSEHGDGHQQRAGWKLAGKTWLNPCTISLSSSRHAAHSPKAWLSCSEFFKIVTSFFFPEYLPNHSKTSLCPHHLGEYLAYEQGFNNCLLNKSNTSQLHGLFHRPSLNHLSGPFLFHADCLYHQLFCLPFVKFRVSLLGILIWSSCQITREMALP